MTPILTSATEALKAIPSFHGINEYTLERAARAVAVAVLEHARDSVSDETILEGVLAFGPDVSTLNVEACFRAMITALLAELDGTESEGR